MPARAGAIITIGFARILDLLPAPFSELMVPACCIAGPRTTTARRRSFVSACCPIACLGAVGGPRSKQGRGTKAQLDEVARYATRIGAGDAEPERCTKVRHPRPR